MGFRIRIAGVLHCASFSNLPIVSEMPLPISAALLANSDLLGFASPFAAAFCESVRSDCRCAPTFDDACRFWTWVRTDLNSVVRSWIEDTAMLTRVAGRDQEIRGNGESAPSLFRSSRLGAKGIVFLLNRLSTAFRRLGSRLLD